MARPKLTTAQRKSVTITVPMRLDQDEGLAAVAVLRRTTKSGLVSQFAAEQIRLEQERDRPRFDAAVEDVRFQREAERRKRSGQLLFERPSCSPDSLKATIEQRPLATLPCVESQPHDRSIVSLSNAHQTLIHALCGVHLSSHNEQESLVAPQMLTPTRSIWHQNAPNKFKQPKGKECA
jgi:hypothetical protein